MYARTVLEAMRKLVNDDPEAQVIIDWFDKETIQNEIRERRGWPDYNLSEIMWEAIVDKLDDCSGVDAEIIYEAFREIEQEVS